MICGRILQTFSEGEKIQGQHELEIDLAGFSQGIYFCKIIVGNQQQVVKMINLKKQ